MVTTTINRAAQRVLALQEWWSAESKSFSRLCGETVFNSDVVKAHSLALVVITLIGIGGALWHLV